MSPLLKAQAITMQFGGLKAVDNVDINIEVGEIHSLIGPNGAGKTTFFNVISGIYIPTAGKVFFEDVDITRLKTHEITRKGITRTFQNILLFETLTALENVMVGHHIKTKYNMVEGILQTKKMKTEELACIKESRRLIEFVGLEKYIETKARNLPYGKKRILEIARALASGPKIIMLDEPCAGMNDQEKDELKETLIKIRDSGITILLVEHDMRFVMGISDVITVLDQGKKIFEGLPNEVINNDEVIDAYLGRGD